MKLLILLVPFLLACKSEAPKPCPEIPVEVEEKFEVKIGDCFRGRTAYYAKISERYKVLEIGKYSVLVKYKKEGSTKSSTDAIYTFEEIKKLTRIDCLGDLK